ncbi:hypothetical protein RM780_21840 [Streptomyces sp. DSM 44917]|uniref:ATP-binding protein n=1 Tax=Streptomyces boetiae TaxID=3075541 RepID=A0ABU2LDB4_9ACTN|nr:hypothetical protein [Streptomyces sp. DSM 44917]MDT0309579.1 hypothetical protein [Streptomyces sp. DSM 44917]
MGERVDGLEAVLDGLVPRLVGAQRLTNDWVEREFPGGAPVVEIVGGRAGGKSTLLRSLAAGYRNRLPLAEADLAQLPDFGEPEFAEVRRPGPQNASALTHLLYLLSHRLSLAVGSFRRHLSFPRLSCGLVPVTAWEPPEGGIAPQGLAEVYAQLRALLSDHEAGQRQVRQALRAWVDALLPVVAGLPGIPGVEAAVEAALRTARGPLAGRPERGPLRWWRDRLPEHQGNAEQRLFSMVADFRVGGAGREAVERLLVEAFLADIADHYGALSRSLGTPLPLVLLDNAHTPVGRAFLARLVPARQALLRDGETGRPLALPAIVAASLGDGAAVPSVRLAARSSPPPARGLLRLGIPHVGAEEVRAMLTARRTPGDAGFPPELAALIGRLSGGRPGCAAILADAVALRRRTAGANAGASGGNPPEGYAPGGNARGAGLPEPVLFDLPAVDDPSRSVGEHLAELLLPDARLREALTVLAPALDSEAARRLWRDQGGADESLDAALAELAGAHWHHTPWPWPERTGGDGQDPVVPLVTDRALHALLLHRRAGGEGAAEKWRRAHVRLRALANPRDLPENAVTHGLRYLHHTLALGRPEPVVRALHHRLGTQTPAAWLAAVNAVCAAPRPPRGAEPPPADPAPCPACAAEGVTGEESVTHRAVGQLVRGLWHCADPLAPAPEPDDVYQVTTGLQALALLRDDRTLRAVLNVWPQLIGSGLQAPDLPVPRTGTAPRTGPTIDDPTNDPSNQGEGDA